MTLPPDKAQLTEIGFAIVFSTVVVVAFYALTSMNGLVLGNDPAVHLERAKLFLQTGQIPLANIGWTPPLFQILLALLISLTGAASVVQLIFLVKASAAVISWLLVFSVYCVGTKFLGRRIGAVASVLMLLSFPMFEISQWGGYTSVMGIAFVMLLLLYLPSSVTGFGYLLVTAFMAFSVVLSHQLATFVSALIVTPIVFVMLVKSRGRHIKALGALVLGGGIAFFLYYYQAVMPYLGGIIEHVFLAQRTTLYQIPTVSLSAFMVNFGFILVAGLVGIFATFCRFRRQKHLTLWLILLLGLAVPFVLAESYVFGLFLPFQWFVYYLMPPLAVFAAAFFIPSLDKIVVFYHKYSRRRQKFKVSAVVVVLTVLVAALLLVRMETIYQEVGKAGVFYSTSDIKGYDAGAWLNENYLGEATTVVTEVPGTWFQVFSGKNVTAATDPLFERNLMAEAVLNLAYELQSPQTLLECYAAKGDFADETSVQINGLWNRVAFSSLAGDNLSYNKENGEYVSKKLSNLTRAIGFDESRPPRLVISFTDGVASVVETIAFQNDSYPISIKWSLSANREIANVTLYLTTYFDLSFHFNSTYLPGLLNWQNPWEHPTVTQEPEWAAQEFNSTTLTDSYVGVYDEQNSVTFALRFDEAPEWGNIGALESRQIDALRFQYGFEEITPSQPASFGYQIVTFSRSTNPSAQAFPDIERLFAAKINAFEVESRSFLDYIRENDVKFVVYDKNQLDTKLANSKVLELVYSNNRYVVFKVRESQ